MRDKKVDIRVEFELAGTASEIEQVIKDIHKAPDGKVNIGTWPTPQSPIEEVIVIPIFRKKPFPGILPLAKFDRVFVKELDKRFDGIRINIGDIYGGIRSPHLHFGNEVVLIGHEEFKEVIVDAIANLPDEIDLIQVGEELGKAIYMG